MFCICFILILRGSFNSRFQEGFTIHIKKTRTLGIRLLTTSAMLYFRRSRGPPQEEKERGLISRTAASNRAEIRNANRDLKHPGRVCGRRREKTSEVWVENVVQSGKNKCLSKLPSRLVAEVGRLRTEWLRLKKYESYFFSLAMRTTQLTRKNFSYSPKDLNQ